MVLWEIMQDSDGKFLDDNIIGNSESLAQGSSTGFPQAICERYHVF